MQKIADFALLRGNIVIIVLIVLRTKNGVQIYQDIRFLGQSRVLITTRYVLLRPPKYNTYRCPATKKRREMNVLFVADPSSPPSLRAASI